MMIACADVDETYGKRLTFCLLPLHISPLQTFILLVSTSRKPSSKNGSRRLLRYELKLRNIFNKWRLHRQSATARCRST